LMSKGKTQRKSRGCANGEQQFQMNGE